MIKSQMQFINETMKDEGDLTMADEKEIAEIVRLLSND